MLALLRLALCLMLPLWASLPITAWAAAPFQDNYPDGNKPCLAGDPRNAKSSYGKTSGSGYWCAGYAWGNLGGSEYSSRGYSYRNCTDWAAFRVPELTGRAVPRSLGNANTWDDRAPGEWEKDGVPEPGDIAQTDSGSYGHVGVVEEVKRNADGGMHSITVSAYNAKQDGTYTTEVSVPDGNVFRRPGGGTWGVFIDPNGPNKGIDGVALTAADPPEDNTVLQVAKRVQDDGVNLVYWAKAGTVFESWWRPGGDGVHVTNLIGITQHDITAIDVQLRADGQHLVYTATAHNVWETWWYPGQAKHTAPLIQQAGNIRDIQKTVGPDGSQQLYVLTDRGVDEYWWWPGGSLQRSRIYTLAQPVAIRKLEAGAAQILYAADQGYVYEVSWGGDSKVRVSEVMRITQRDITDLDAALDTDMQRRVYVGRQRDGVWEAVWRNGGTWSFRQITGDQGVRQVRFYRDGTIPVIYIATAGGVFEYWWTIDDPRVRGSVVTVQADIHGIDRATTNGAQTVYTAANTRVFESWWWPGGSGIHTKPIT